NMARAVFLTEEKEEIARIFFFKQKTAYEIQVLNGRFGPYISDGRLNGKIPKDREPSSLTLEEVVRLLEETGKPARRGFGAKKAAKKAPARKAAADKDAAPKKAPAKKAAKKAPAKATRKTEKKAASKSARNQARPYSADLEPAQSLVTAAKFEPGRKRVVKKGDDAPF